MRRIAVMIALLSAAPVVVSALAGISFFRRDSLVWRHAEGIYTVQLDRGSIIFFDYTRAQLGGQPLAWTVLPPGSGPRVGYRGLGFTYKAWSAADPTFFVGIPLWIAIVPLLLADLLCIRRWRRLRYRASYGLCPRCEYDVRASPSACPECGLRLSPPAI